MKLALARLLSFLLSISILLGVAACAPSRPVLEKKNDSIFFDESSCLVAFLPFYNDSSYEQGGGIAQRIFAAELNRLAGIQVSSDADVRNVFQELHIYPNQSLEIDQIRMLGSRLGVQRIISGRVLEMEEKTGEHFVNPKLTLTLNVYDADSGQMLWSTYHSREGINYRKVMHFGLINTVTQLSRIMSDEIIQEWFAEGMKQCGK
jgi:TolB-like protein